jgi:predicted nucleic acid-binding protein
VILVETSAWVELFRRTGSPVHRRLRQLVQKQGAIGITEPVVMELLAGSQPYEYLSDVRRRLLKFRMLRVGGLETYERAAEIQRVCRARGEAIRNMTDCLIAAVAIREGVSVLHRDRDFDVIARHTSLLIECPR